MKTLRKILVSRRQFKVYSSEILKLNYLPNSTIIEGDSRSALEFLPEKSVQCVITSPPYWGVRDYGVFDQIGLEADLENYLKNLVFVFESVRRVLKDDGVMWVNIGDVYSSGNRKYRAPDKKYQNRALSTRPRTPLGLKAKDLLGIPWRLAFALQNYGWYLRADIVWHKPNAMPESVKDRPQRCHEYFFLFSKSEKYSFQEKNLPQKDKRILRSVWTFPTKRSKLNGHSATFPDEIVFPCISSATKKGDLVLDPFCGTGTVGRVCSKLSRRFVGVEINPKYAKAAANFVGAKVNVSELNPLP